MTAINDIRTLRWLLLGLGATLWLHAGHFTLWVTLAAIVLGTWRYVIAHYRWPLPRIRTLMPLTLAGAVGIFMYHHGITGRSAGSELLALMLMLKLMEASTRRDFIILIFGGYFLTITLFLFTQTMGYAGAVLLPTFALTAALIGISDVNGGLRWGAQVRLAALLLLQAIPAMLVLFLLFPRVPGPLWGIPQSVKQGLSGLSDSMEPGEISDLTFTGDVAFRVEFEGAPPPAHTLYWRGPVLWRYDGRSWHAGDDAPVDGTTTLTVRGPATRYTITLEPHDRRLLLLLDMPAELPPDSTISRGFQALSRQPVQERIRYQASSYLDYALDASGLSRRDRDEALRLPAGYDPRTRELARRWRRELRSPEAIAEAALQMFHDQPFRYTLRPPPLGRNAIDDFLFTTRRGFCEHYASSFVYLMRAAGVPARVVTGYQGGELNPVGNYLIVRQSDAHAWAEVWLPQRGWVRMDPTAAVSPSRVESGIEAAIPEVNLLPLMARKQYPALNRLYFNFDAINYAWNHWILDYNQKRQLRTLSRLLGSQVTWQALVFTMIAALGIVALLLGYWLLRGPARTSLARSYDDFLRKLRQHGIERRPHEGALDFGDRAARRLPQQAALIRDVSALYSTLSYGRNRGRERTAELLARLRHMVRALQ